MKKSIAAVGILGLITSIGVIIERITRPEQTSIAWDQVITPPDSISSVKFKSYVDGSLIGSEIFGVICTPNGVLFICQTKINNLNLTSQLHTIRISTVGAGGESLKSPPIEINFLVTHE